MRTDRNIETYHKRRKIIFSRKGRGTNCLQIRRQLLSDPNFGNLLPAADKYKNT